MGIEASQWSELASGTKLPGLQALLHYFFPVVVTLSTLVKISIPMFLHLKDESEDITIFYIILKVKKRFILQSSKEYTMRKI